ncbi:Uncharacterised protein [Fusobacterium necrogenes]|uniref:Inner membrane protein n=1 Tax=Fusobacterium necrogenes TaxID=858 RepID=A0A377GUN1_9FUSO|nr:hypothetical protein [Fusobacterium necrogenes]STO30680.1 Uncharacterised protein [Fusobacterium necrogenes]
MEFLIEFVDEVPLICIFISFAAFFLGIKFPDWDFKMRLKHRSIVTHSPLILLIFIKVYEQDGSNNFRYFLIGFSLALALHFIYDIYPKAWGGGALIKIPILKISCNLKISKMILLFSIITSILVAISYTEKLMEFYYLGILGIISILKDTRKEKKLFRPLFSFIILGLMIGCIKYKELFYIFRDGVFYITSKISMFF